MDMKLISDYTDNSETVGYYRNFGHDISISAIEVKEYIPKDLHKRMSMSEGVKALKEVLGN